MKARQTVKDFFNKVDDSGTLQIGGGQFKNVPKLDLTGLTDEDIETIVQKSEKVTGTPPTRALLKIRLVLMQKELRESINQAFERGRECATQLYMEKIALLESTIQCLNSSHCEKDSEINGLKSENRKLPDELTQTESTVKSALEKLQIEQEKIRDLEKELWEAQDEIQRLRKQVIKQAPAAQSYDQKFFSKPKNHYVFQEDASFPDGINEKILLLSEILEGQGYNEDEVFNFYEKEKFLCPIRMTMMTDPVIDPTTGIIYDRNTLTELEKSPVSREPIHIDERTPSVVYMKNEIASYLNKKIKQARSNEFSRPSPSSSAI